MHLMSKFLLIFLFAFALQSCSIFSRYRRSDFTYTANGQSQTVRLVVPKGYSRTELKKDAAGNEVKYYYYSGGTQLYFAALTDTALELQPILYDINIPRELFNSIYYKGIDSNGRYWRETRFDHFKSGYRNVKKGRDGRFDSSMNYFSLHIPR